MSDLIQKTLRTISERHIRPASVWISRLKNGAFWGGTLFLAVLSTVAMAVSWHVVFEIDWQAYVAAHFSWIRILLSGVPFLTLFLLGIFLWASIMFLHRTRHGYRYPFLVLTVAFFVGSLVFGYALEISSLDQPAEHLLLRAFPLVGTLQAALLPSAKRQWSQPERGLLGGVVQSSGATDMTLIDASQALWTVDYSRATVDRDVSLDRDEQVKVIGSQDGERTFRATEVRAWEKPHGDKRESVNRELPEESTVQQGKGNSAVSHEEDASSGKDGGDKNSSGETIGGDTGE